MQSKPEKPPIPKPPKPPKNFPGLNKPKSDTSTPKPSIKDINSIRTISNIMMVSGFLMMLYTLIVYETSVCKKARFDFLNDDCTYNIGLIGNKNNLIMFGGFLFLGGCVLFKNDGK